MHSALHIASLLATPLAAAKSKVPFYIAGGVLVAVLLRSRDVANVATSFPGFVPLARSVGLAIRESMSRDPK